MMSEYMETDVIIVGGGPIGLILSSILGKSNINNIVIEKNLETTNWPKATYINPRSMELFNHYGFGESLYQASSPGKFLAANCVSLTKSSPSEVVELTEDFVEKTEQGPDGQISFVRQEISSSKACRISQIQLEPALRKVISNFESCNVLCGWKVTSVSQDEETVTASIVHVNSTGETKTIKGRYLIGCDGANSYVREALGIKQIGEFAVANICSILFESSELRKRLRDPEILAHFLYKNEFLVVASPVDAEKLFIAHVISWGNDGNESSEDYVKIILDNDVNVPFELIQEHAWKANITHVEAFQQGRVFLAGDAGHCLVPLGGTGINCGIGDAFNLGWKLVAMVQGWGGEWLLDSYASENLSYYKKVVEVNKKSFEVAKCPSNTGFLMTTAPFKYLFSRFARKFLKGILGNEGLTFGFMLRNSPVCVPSGLTNAIEDREFYINEAFSGCRVPHFRFPDGTTLDSMLGEMFTLICLSGDCKETSKFIGKFSKETGLPLKLLEFDDVKLKQLFKVNMVLIRPDFYIAWCGDEIPQLSEGDSVRARARVLINVISGATPLPPEWAWSRVQWVPALMRKRDASRYWVIPVVSAVICVAGIITYTVLHQN